MADTSPDPAVEDLPSLAAALVGLPSENPPGDEQRCAEFVARGTPAIVREPGSLDQAHTVDEWIDLGEAACCLEVAKAGIRETLAGGI